MNILVVLFSVFLAGASEPDKTPQELYIEKYSPLAVREMRRSGIPASITLAQGLVESEAGMSTLAVKANNHFGIKCHENWHGARIYHDDDAKGECFRSYPKAQDSFSDHSDFLRYRDRYKFLFDLDKTDYKGWARGLKKAGYATDPKYADKLIAVIEKYHLYDYDVAKKVPPSPLKLEKRKEVVEGEPFKASETVVYSLSPVKFKKNGAYYIVASGDESYADIAFSYGLFLDELLRYNDLKSSPRLEKGMVVYLSSKRQKAEKGLEKYVVDSDGQSLWEISQRFAVRESSLRKMNSLPEGAELKKEDIIRLR